MQEKKYYDGTKLLSLMDINGDKPEIYICTSNRTAGKTTYFARLCVNKFIQKGEKFCLVYRYNYELDSVADKFFKDINTLFFQDYAMHSERRANGIYHELFLQKAGKEMAMSCGYAISLNSADQLKRFSHLLSDVDRMFFDEFQSETNHYCSNEIQKLMSIHTSIARGQGKQIRYVPVYLCGNPVSLLNPYYIELGISNRLRSNTRFLKGEGFVLEQGFNQSAADSQKGSAFNRAFSQNKYLAYSSENVYLNDCDAFVEKPEGRSRYLCTIKCDGKEYAIREFIDLGYIYCDDRPDTSFRIRLAVTTDDHNINYVMLKNNDMFFYTLRKYFEKGCFRFKNIQCKAAILKAISY